MPFLNKAKFDKLDLDQKPSGCGDAASFLCRLSHPTAASALTAAKHMELGQSGHRFSLGWFPSRLGWPRQTGVDERTDR